MAREFLRYQARQQRMLRPVTFIAAVVAFCLSLGAIPPFAALLLALAAGFMAGKLNEAVHHGSLLGRILGGGALSVVLILAANCVFGVPFVVGGIGCLVMYVLM